VTINGAVLETPDLFRKVQADLWIVLTAGLTPVKRVDLFLQAFSRVVRKCPETTVHAVVLGEGPEEQQLKALRHELGLRERVHFVGAVKNVTAYLHYADIGVLCSQKEGLSNAILEYMSASLPIVATEVGGTPELVDNTNGVCVKPGDAEALAQAITRLVEDEEVRREKGRKSLEKVQARFSWSKTMSETEDFYRHLCGLG